ncbi:hypothetical protein RF11_04383 [Thelohanellus kitauei]|uniref:Uncharacterized protein n=1 Tax=Thelohanellus kitauei TaxID=669202 RepID=A0A0C2MN14_THEKT|nr:hypothetical protein RF11_04383 [Thelohanellus kitauei]
MLDKFEIKFQGSNTTCEESLSKTKTPISVKARFESTDEIYFCKLNETELTTDSVTDVSTNDNGQPLTTPSFMAEKLGHQKSVNSKQSTTSLPSVSRNNRGRILTPPTSLTERKGFSDSVDSNNSNTSVTPSEENENGTHVTRPGHKVKKQEPWHENKFLIVTTLLTVIVSLVLIAIITS